MIQELLGSGVIGGERKSSSIPFPNCPPPTAPIFTASSATPSTTKAVNSSSGANNNSESTTTTTTAQQNLRCPRCDSTNTKFCYYNNYNLTQPRHFCKTCRRYWTKGGTLRNVPIGGGCRKNKTTTHVSGGASSAASGLKPSSNGMANYKAKAMMSTEMLLNGSPGFLGNGLLDPYSDLQSPGFWPSIPQGQSSHILTLLRGATQFSNPNPNPNANPSLFTPLKAEGNTTLGLDPYGNGAPSILGSFLRGNQHPLNGFGLGAPDAAQNGGNSNSNILELYQRLKSSGSYNYCGNENPGSIIFSNVMGSSSSSSPSPSPSAMNSSILEASNGGGGDNMGGYGMMNSSLGFSGWSDFPTVPINGAFP